MQINDLWLVLDCKLETMRWQICNMYNDLALNNLQ